MEKQSSLIIQKLTIISSDEYSDLVTTIDRKVRLFDSFESPKDFFLQLAEFYTFLTKNPILNTALDIIYRDYEEESKKLDDLRKAVGLEAETAFKQLRGIVLKNGLINKSDLKVIEEYYGNYEQYRNRKKRLTKKQVKILNQTTNQILAEIKDYYSWKAGASQSLTNTPFESLIVGAVEAIVRACKESGYLKPVKRYVELENSPLSGEYIKNYKVSKSDVEFTERKKLIDQKLEASAWHSFQMIKLVPLCLYDYPDYWNELNKEHRMAEMMNLGGLVKEMEKIVNGSNTYDLIWFKQQDYKLHLNRLVDAILDVLKMIKNISNNAQSDPTLQPSVTNLKIDQGKETAVPAKINYGDFTLDTINKEVFLRGKKIKVSIGCGSHNLLIRFILQESEHSLKRGEIHKVVYPQVEYRGNSTQHSQINDKIEALRKAFVKCTGDKKARGYLSHEDEGYMLYSVLS